MFEYWFSISKNSKFLFRTDKFDSKEQAKMIFDELQQAFPVVNGYNIVSNKRAASYNSVENTFID